MYGIVNKAIEELVIDQFGYTAWEDIRKRSGIGVDFFISTEAYDDDITYKLAVTTSEVLNLDIGQVMIALGEFWILKVGKTKYSGLMESGGNNLREFLVNLPQFHNRIMLLYPKLTPPEFKISEVAEKSIHVHYFSHRPGLQDFVRGLLQGLGKMYQTETLIEMVQHRKDGADHDIFRVSWS